ncbi:MAG TPA: TetR/AcrR family transcriptional regulator [Beutenbergiaceae bacterium]|nr:TetR/AcrR family transcriptional regulator [Beutenbergiaceae bacterium]
MSRTVNLGDPRAQRSREAILRAAQDIADHRDSTFSIAEVIRRSGISKSTFYLHFADLDDLCFHLLEASLTTINADDVRARTRHDDPRAVTWAGHARVVDHLLQRRSLYLELISTSARARVRERFTHLIADLLHHSMAATAAAPERSQIRVSALYVASGFTTVVTEWLDGRLHLDRDELVEALVGLAPPWFRDEGGTEDYPSDRG